MSEREEQQKRGAGSDRVSTIVQVEHSVPAAAALIATIEKAGKAEVLVERDFP